MNLEHPVTVSGLWGSRGLVLAPVTRRRGFTGDHGRLPAVEVCCAGKEGRKEGIQNEDWAFLHRLLSHLALCPVLSEASPNVFQLSYLSAPRNLPLSACPPFSVCSLRQSGEYIPCRSSPGEGEQGQPRDTEGQNEDRAELSTVLSSHSGKA